MPTQSTRAYDFYVSGKRYQWSDDNSTDTPLAVQQYERAVEEDPEFALAWARLSMAHIDMYWFAIDRTEERRNMSRSAVERALEIQRDLSEAHLAMAWYHYHGYRDYEEALRELAIAEQGLPGDAELIFARALIHRRQGEWERALTGMAQALELDPRNVEVLLDHGFTYRALRDYAQAERQVDRALAITPDALDAYIFKAQIALLRDGDVSPLKAAAENPPFALGHERGPLGWTAAVYERDYDMALSYLDRWEIDEYATPEASYYGVTYQLAGESELATGCCRAAGLATGEALSLQRLSRGRSRRGRSG